MNPNESCFNPAYSVRIIKTGKCILFDILCSTIKSFDVIPLQAPVVDARVRRAEVLQAEQHLQKDQLVLLGPAFVLAVVLWRCQ